jgi:hypothetical protein
MNKKIAAFFLTVILTPAVQGLFAQTGVIKELSGTVELKPPGARDFAAAKAGDSISQDTVISTGFKSSALVEVGNAIITVRPLTRLTLTEISASSGGENLNLKLRSGRVRAELNPPAGTKSSMSVSSPVATASVRGTKFDFDTRNLYVERGSVSFRGARGGAALVNAGSWSYIDNSSRAADPIDASNSRLLPNAPVGANSTGAVSTGNGGNTQPETPGTTPETTVTIKPVY